MFDNGHVEGAQSSFTEAEAQYLAENIIGRVATCSPSGEPHIVPVLYRFDGSAILFGGANMTRTLEFRNMMGNNRVSFLVDDLASMSPLKARGVEVRGSAEPVAEEEGVTTVRIIPLNIRSWGLGE